MKPSAKTKKEVLQVYDAWMHSYLTGDVQTYDHYLDKEYHFIGSTNNEEFLPKKETTQFFRDTGEQFANKTDLRNEIRFVEEFEGLIFITHLFDAWFLSGEEWSYYGRFRFSSVARKKKEEWRFIYQHFSMPDSRAEEGETIGFDQISAENLQLREAIKRRTIELENRNRDLEIERSLERVRTVTMSMRHSSELAKIGEVIFEELKTLGFHELRNSEIVINQEDNDELTSYYYSDYGVSGVINIQIKGNPILEKWVADINKAHDAFAEVFISEKEMEGWRTYRDSLGYVPDPKLKEAKNLYYYSYSFGLGALSISSFSSLAQEQLNILHRFRNVFDLSYQRYTDIQKAEAQVRESLIEAALERVRSRTMGMQKSDELGEVATVLFTELNKLVDNLWTCGFVLCEEGRDEDEWWLSAENGFIPAFYLPNVGDVTHNNIYNAWKNGAEYHTEQLEGDALQEHYDWLMEIPVAKQIFEDMQASGIEIPTWQKLHCAFFKTGYLVIITQVPCPEEEIFKRFAQAFDLTYTRFLDLQLKETQARKLAEDKEKLERTLTDLKATQGQLIQSEKMASLGELTAGIAHEIQNPLNFVNNFSEVSRELIEEMLEEIQKGDMEEVQALAGDIVQNLEKIRHHGQRADGIVKGMLQHSRASSGEKELTDINVLADEYLRLAYHGLRAKDKSFNATLETHFDESLSKIRVVPQDIGRVILNLLTNAFHVVQEKKAKVGDKYTPTVTVITRNGDKGVEIIVMDNGKGIPVDIREKIFQPFFTTKPTGQGTGLGLSMSYDIVTKGHHGELMVTSEEGKGTTFTVVLPKGKREETKKRK